MPTFTEALLARKCVGSKTYTKEGSRVGDVPRRVSRQRHADADIPCRQPLFPGTYDVRRLVSALLISLRRATHLFFARQK